MDKITHTLDPIIDERSEVLILGSMPGVESLKKGEYYAHPRNHFWPILYALFNEPLEPEYSKRIIFLKDHGIALWDVIGSCRRKGSLDSTITDICVNDIEGLLKRYSNISLIVLNGTKAETTFMKFIHPDLAKPIKAARAPSTSPVPGKNVKTYAQKLSEWERILMPILHPNNQK